MLRFLANMGNAVRVGILLAILSGGVLYVSTLIDWPDGWVFYEASATFIWVSIIGVYVCLVVLAQLIVKNRAA